MIKQKQSVIFESFFFKLNFTTFLEINLGRSYIRKI